METLLDWAGRVIEGRYRLVRLIGEGGMGVVYEGRHEVLLRTVAVKLVWPAYAMDPSAIRRFHREAQAAGRIGHDNICEVLDLGQTSEGIPYMVMPLLRGTSLADEIVRCRVVPLDRTIDIMGQVLNALAAAHDHGIVHRDLKPDNIFLTSIADRNDLVKILDFGVAKVLHGSASVSAPHITKTGTVVGTASYMSPEQARGAPDIDQRVDVYAAGAVLYEMLTGVRMYDGMTYNEVIHKIFSGDVKMPSEIRANFPLPLERVISRAIARLPEHRFLDARTFRAALLAAAEEVRSFSARVTVSAPEKAAANRHAADGRPEAAAAKPARLHAVPAVPPRPEPPAVHEPEDAVSREGSSPPPEHAPAAAQKAGLDSTLPIAKAAVDHVAAREAEPSPIAAEPSVVVSFPPLAVAAADPATDRKEEPSLAYMEPSVASFPIVTPGEGSPDSAPPVATGKAPRPASSITAAPRTTYQSVRAWKPRGPWRAIVPATLVVAAVAVYVVIEFSGGRGASRPEAFEAGGLAGSPARQTTTRQMETPPAVAAVALPATPPAMPARSAMPESPAILRPAPSANPPPTTTAPAPAAPEAGAAAPALPTVVLSFPPLPESASVEVAGKQVTLADQKLAVPQSSEVLHVAVAAPGYRDWRGTILPDRDRIVPVSLARERAPGEPRDGTERAAPDAGGAAPPAAAASNAGVAAASPDAGIAEAERPAADDAGAVARPAETGPVPTIQRAYDTGAPTIHRAYDAGSATGQGTGGTSGSPTAPPPPAGTGRDATTGGIRRSYDAP